MKNGMDKTPTDTSTNAALTSTTTPTEARTLRDVVYSAKPIGGSYGSLAKSQTQAIFYISHKVESDDTLQRLALKYSINIQELKRVNKLWSDAELGLREYIYIPTNSTQLSILQTTYPTLEIVQDLPPIANPRQKTSDETNSSIRSSDSTTSIPAAATNNSSYQDYLSKIDRQIRSSKDSLQSLDIRDPSNNTTFPESPRTSIGNNERHKGIHHLSDNSVFVNISTQTTRDKHISAALKRIQQEKDNFDEL